MLHSNIKDNKNLPYPLFFKEGNSSLWQREVRRNFKVKSKRTRE